MAFSTVQSVQYKGTEPVLPGVARARGVQGPPRHDPPELALAQGLLQHQALPGELKLLINLEIRFLSALRQNRMSIIRVGGELSENIY